MRAQPHPAEAFALENSIIGPLARADDARVRQRRPRRQQSKGNHYADLARKTSSFAPKIMRANRLIHSCYRVWSEEGCIF
jgi:hypothetical protein